MAHDDRTIYLPGMSVINLMEELLKIEDKGKTMALAFMDEPKPLYGFVSLVEVGELVILLAVKEESK